MSPLVAKIICSAGGNRSYARCISRFHCWGQTTCSPTWWGASYDLIDTTRVCNSFLWDGGRRCRQTCVLPRTAECISAYLGHQTCMAQLGAPHVSDSRSRPEASLGLGRQAPLAFRWFHGTGGILGRSMHGPQAGMSIAGNLGRWAVTRWGLSHVMPKSYRRVQ